MGPEHGPSPPSKASEVGALNLCRVDKGHIRGTLLKGPY